MLPSVGSLSFNGVSDTSMFLWDTRGDALRLVFIHEEVLWALSRAAGADLKAFMNSLGWCGSALELTEVIVKNIQANQHMPVFPTDPNAPSFVFQTELVEEEYSMDIPLPFEQPVTAKEMRAIVLLQTAATPLPTVVPEVPVEVPVVVPEVPVEVPVVVPEVPVEVPVVVSVLELPVHRETLHDSLLRRSYIHGQQRAVFKFRGMAKKN